jgi:hypothetical protein
MYRRLARLWRSVLWHSQPGEVQRLTKRSEEMNAELIRVEQELMQADLPLPSSTLGQAAAARVGQVLRSQRY